MIALKDSSVITTHSSRSVQYFFTLHSHFHFVSAFGRLAAAAPPQQHRILDLHLLGLTSVEVSFDSHVRSFATVFLVCLQPIAQGRISSLLVSLHCCVTSFNVSLR